MMATQRLYWEDPYRCEFEANIVAELRLDGKWGDGIAHAVVLDTTCFYPTSGGQPHDEGTLNGRVVLDVVEVDEGVAHVLAEPLPSGSVHGVIDWSRRFGHMQQHTGQHILSQAFERQLDATTISFHLGETISTIDVTVPSLDEKAAARVEDLANRIVLENRPVTTQEYDEGEVQSLPLRKLPQVHGLIRVVHIDQFDFSACGGTHVRATEEVGCIHLRRWERCRGGSRVEFLCGWRALGDYRARDLLCQTLANELSTAVGELSGAMARLREAEQSARHQAEGLRKRVLDLELSRLAGEAERIGELRVLCRLLEDYDAGNMRYMAQNLIQKPGIVVLLAVTDPSPQICFARSDDVDVDMGQLLRAATAPYGGRGGGRAHFAQGGGVAAADLVPVLAAAREQISSRSLPTGCGSV